MAQSIPPVKDRIEKVKEMRLDSTDAGAHRLASRPYQFREMNEAEEHLFIIPSVVSENRNYVAVGFETREAIVSNLAFALYDASMHLFSVLSSRLHFMWGVTVGGRLKTDPRYSSKLVYNTFPVRDFSSDQIAELGFTSGKMEVRIQNAQDDPTFLMASVYPVATYTLYNIDTSFVVKWSQRSLEKYLQMN